ncbi:MAG TPA: nucleotide exchange factor GrpE [Bacillus sp. (in: firmicutes)]|uniref:nucleotide exchange factor GrpE n=1 Tax=Bacillus litorisediminis TaxID=2922713 RepID=UPI001FAE2A8E|nr:nucleotide exchange factor GrpE [Bacillus litorisediminis]HWO77701.1 nucleotide exchange factor GrpE [Bacillus sp. (in: firmicutes)]
MEQDNIKEDTTLENEKTESVTEAEEAIQPEEKSGASGEDEKDQLALANEKIRELEQKLEEAENKQLRLHADFENFKRRLQNEKLMIEKYKAQSLVTDLLPALDNFERALKADQVDDSLRPFFQGMEMVYKSILEALKNAGVEQIEAAGKPFDPHLHQAVMKESSSEYEPDTVIEEFQKGYKLKDRVIRPSMVKVSE